MYTKADVNCSKCGTYMGVLECYQVSLAAAVAMGHHNMHCPGCRQKYEGAVSIYDHGGKQEGLLSISPKEY